MWAGMHGIRVVRMVEKDISRGGGAGCGLKDSSIGIWIRIVVKQRHDERRLNILCLRIWSCMDVRVKESDTNGGAVWAPGSRQVNQRKEGHPSNNTTRKTNRFHSEFFRLPFAPPHPPRAPSPVPRSPTFKIDQVLFFLNTPTPPSLPPNHNVPLPYNYTHLPPFPRHKTLLRVLELDRVGLQRDGAPAVVPPLLLGLLVPEVLAPHLFFLHLLRSGLRCLIGEKRGG